MATKSYMAMFEPTKSGFGISFPDLPGCVSYAENLDDGVRNASEALSLHLEGMAEDGETLPDARRFGDLVAGPDQPPSVVWVLISVEAPDAADRVNVYLPRSLLGRVDRYVADHAPMNRSTFFGEAARTLLRMSNASDVGQSTQMSYSWRSPEHSAKSRLVTNAAYGVASSPMLRDVLEYAGLKKKIDFVEQVLAASENGRSRPDVKVHMPDGRFFVIDAKCSLNAFLDALDAKEEPKREDALARHAQSLHSHVSDLSRMSYWEQFQTDGLPDFVAMYVPSDSFLTAALDRLPSLMTEAMNNRVLLVTPSTLYALCKVIAYGRRGLGARSSQKADSAGSAKQVLADNA